MAEARRPGLFTIAVSRPFADALAAGLLRRFGGNALALARGLILVPNNRARRAVTDAFVRASGGALLLPRIATIGDPDIDESVGAALDPIDAATPVPPAIDTLHRRLLLARMVSDARAGAGDPVDLAEALRLGADLGAVLDQLLVEEIDPQRLATLDHGGDALNGHWQASLDQFRLILDAWPQVLAARGAIDLARRRTMLLDRLAGRWRRDPPPHFICAAGITSSAPAIARLMKVIAMLPHGMVVLPGLSLAMPEAEWQALGPHEPDPATGLQQRSIETHPQFQLKLLLDRMGVNRAEFDPWDEARDAVGEARGVAIDNAMAPAQFTGKWTSLAAAGRRLPGVRAIELASPAEEAQAIALAFRQTLEVPGRTAALITPDRSLARRVAAHCRRWGIEVDDSAGRSLDLLPSGTLLIELAEAAAQRFAPIALLALLKHPLVQFGAARLDWLEGARQLDLALRGPRPVPGLAGITAHLAQQSGRDARVRRRAAEWWATVSPLLEPIEAAFAAGTSALPALLATLRETATQLSGDAVWGGPAGRAAADLLADLEMRGDDLPPSIDPAGLAAALRTLMADIAVRPPQGGHPRLAIYGLIEGRLQRADLMILGSLNEGSWPGLPMPDPWLAPRIRSLLGLAGLDRGIGLAAHDFAMALGADEVLLTRARREGTAPTIASRFWLRLEAMLDKGIERDPVLQGWARGIDAAAAPSPVTRPEPKPPAALRPTSISVTEVDRLKADPYAFYAQRILKLSSLDAVDADPGPAWRGTVVHAVLEAWVKEDGAAPDKLADRMRSVLDGLNLHPMLRAMWQPRVIAGIDWIAGEVAKDARRGRHILVVEQGAEIELAGVTLSGRIDRLDRLSDGRLAIVDYKTGKAPTPAAVKAGYNMQLGLLGVIAERQGFAGHKGEVGDFEYWSLARHGDNFGSRSSPVDPEGKRGKPLTEDFTSLAAAQFTAAASDWLTGDRAFTAKLVPEYAPFADYDQLMRLGEWYGR